MGSKPTCPPGCWCEPRPRKVGQGRAPPCRSHRTGIHGKGSRTCWQPCSRARRSQGECTRTRVRSPWCYQQWRWGSKAHPSIPAPTRGRCPCGSSPKNQGSQDCHQHLLQAEHHRHHLIQEARSTRDSSPMPPRLGCQRWSPGQSSWAVGALGINPRHADWTLFPNSPFHSLVTGLFKQLEIAINVFKSRKPNLESMQSSHLLAIGYRCRASLTDYHCFG